MTHRTDPPSAAEHDQSHDWPAPPGRGLAAVTGDDFSPLAAVGGVRGMVESVAPGVVFVVLFVILQDLMIPLVASVAVAVGATVARLVQRTSLATALGGLVGVVIGAVWAWRTGDAENVFVWALWTNAAYLVVMLASILVRWPLIGLFVEALVAGLTPDQVRRNAQAQEASSDSGLDRRSTAHSAHGGAAAAADDDEPNPLAALTAWRGDPAKMRAYTIATWLWVGMFAVRLAVKTPLYFAGTVAWLGTFHLVLGLPLFALVLFGCWVVIRPVLSAGAAASPGRRRRR
ncbi:DUF3159 domain-containing protein [Myceligenerans pegani]|uniref:DUF3159 domain-containing protein n=1 Tax=Myceligenerans pegani TaxID=2776917 RepID=A0ABR9MZL3_9MICO|nr:DUF3159 domain-containing protein [Myceligenerans sp. TRM 65318]MBE1876843.1 DUF3159 domain-containing protein [Myceligenerans sp. TRM 65318]MBE3019114.1 DUF3159 domain-containing protein [Myceligenerans sp. TRM 65318]